jgi:hypothetical protein
LDEFRMGCLKSYPKTYPREDELIMRLKWCWEWHLSPMTRSQVPC